MKPTLREQLRGVIAPVIQRMAGASRKEIREALRAVKPSLLTRKPYGLKCWQQEVAYALRDRSRRMTSRTKGFRVEEIMPCQRTWAAARGLVLPLAVLDVDSDLTASRPEASADPEPFELR